MRPICFALIAQLLVPLHGHASAAGPQVRIGSGGGFAATSRFTRLEADGTLVVEFQTMGRVDAEVKAGRLAPAELRRVAAALSGVDVAALGCTPGNMTDSLEVTRDGLTERACAPMDQGSPAFRALFGRIGALVFAATAGVQPPPPPLPALPEVLWLEAYGKNGRARIARESAQLPAGFADGVRRLSDTEIQRVWRELFAAGFYSGASIESRNGELLPGAPYGCTDDDGVRVLSGGAKGYEIRQRCIEGDSAVQALRDLIAAAAMRD